MHEDEVSRRVVDDNVDMGILKLVDSDVLYGETNESSHFLEEDVHLMFANEC